MAQQTSSPLRGYIEGYYGRLLTWPERIQLLDSIQSFANPVYLYAPKEDANHRFAWRTPYDTSWRESFREFSDSAQARSINLLAGIAPGLDFDYKDLAGGPDLDTLIVKAQQLLTDGAQGLVLLLDDIALNLHEGTHLSEGAAHGTLANTLADALEQPIWLVPRVYANELSTNSIEYLPDLAATLSSKHTLVYCGSHIVAQTISGDSHPDAFATTSHSIVYWDNRYANDYCPRRLFLPPWLQRDGDLSILINPTGMVTTDCWIMALVKATEALIDSGGSEFTTAHRSKPEKMARQAWQKTMMDFAVPNVIEDLANYFDEPHYTDSTAKTIASSTAHLSLLDTLLWEWKGPLAREWYPYLMGLRHDLLLALGEQPAERLHKTQLAPLAQTLLGIKH